MKGKVPPHVEAKIQNLLSEIGEMFKNPKITLVVRNPDLEDGDLIMTNDDCGEAIEAIKKLTEK